MAQYFQIHPLSPQERLVRRAVEVVRNGGLIVYPSDSSYALGCQIDNKDALERIRLIRQLGQEHRFALVCRDLSQISSFTRFGNEAFRLIKMLTPGPFTFILKATKEVPRRLQHPKFKTVGIRIPNSPIVQALVKELGEPLFSSTLIMPGDDEAMSDPYEIRERLEKLVDLIIDADVVPYEPTTIIGFTEDTPEIIRQGKAVVTFLQ
ncbi:MAG: threonylcarbamoyl-AMP synthase [Candidatus Methylumidiphilus alinenensis]|uniref:Threonylcarbamoyl-AMP synthase n=1 Tax=Candidatus Methylumidiphilus alinenensis TaxID=2202197 RepID=A0A2W4R6H3_9GAMM|nr:MAG: threonylcarbamoyl-AMP synthase [Candidatus Methylumidiphilus alinenensis]